MCECWKKAAKWRRRAWTDRSARRPDGWRTIGASHTLSMDEAVNATQEMIDAARAVNPNLTALAHAVP